MKFDLTFFLLNDDEVATAEQRKSSMQKLRPSSPECTHSEESTGNDRILRTSMGTARSTSIPLPSSHVSRTQSELQLSIDEEAAEQRDARMFHRMVNGIRERQHQAVVDGFGILPKSFDQSISRIVQARLAPLDFGGRTAEHHSILSVDSPAEDEQIDDSEAWSISGFENDQPSPMIDGFEDEELGREDEEGVFEMDL